MSTMLHKILVRQLKHYNLKVDVLPEDKQQWKTFIERVSNTYTEFDNERYLIERSMEISSKELLELNNKLENAQHIAGLGYWYYNKESENITWSKELYSLLGFIEGVPPPNFEQFLLMIHESDREKFKQLITSTLANQTSQECEIRVNDKNQNYSWFSIASKFDVNGLTGIAINITNR